MNPSSPVDSPAASSKVSSATTPTSAPDLVIGLIGGLLQTLLRAQIVATKDELTWALSQAARIIRHTERTFLHDEHAVQARYAAILAGSFEAASTYLHDHDLPQILGDAERTALAEPLVLMGASLVLGILIARAAKHVGPATSAAVPA